MHTLTGCGFRFCGRWANMPGVYMHSEGCSWKYVGGRKGNKAMEDCGRLILLTWSTSKPHLASKYFMVVGESSLEGLGVVHWGCVYRQRRYYTLGWRLTSTQTLRFYIAHLCAVQHQWTLGRTKRWVCSTLENSTRPLIYTKASDKSGNFPLTTLY